MTEKFNLPEEISPPITNAEVEAYIYGMIDTWVDIHRAIASKGINIKLSRKLLYEVAYKTFKEKSEYDVDELRSDIYSAWSRYTNPPGDNHPLESGVNIFDVLDPIDPLPLPDDSKMMEDYFVYRANEARSKKEIVDIQWRKENISHRYINKVFRLVECEIHDNPKLAYEETILEKVIALVEDYPYGQVSMDQLTVLFEEQWDERKASRNVISRLNKKLKKYKLYLKRVTLYSIVSTE